MNQEIRKQFEQIDIYAKKEDSLFQQTSKRIGITNATLYILIYLYRSLEPCSQNDIVENWFFPKQTVSFTINKLVEQNLVYMTPIENSKNKKAIKLTDEGMEYCKEHIIPVIHAQEEAFLSLTDEEREAFVHVTNKYYQLLQKNLKNID